MSRKRRWLKRLAIAMAAMLGVVLTALAAGVLLLRAGLPQTSGIITVAGVSAPVRIERDARGIVTIRADDEEDSAFGIGFAHAQDRRFQMDLLRRAAAGELAEVAGPAALGLDEDVRVHQFRRRAEAIVNGFDNEDRQLLESYARGVNAGYRSLGAKPIEFQLLRTDPPDWTPVDTILVLNAMFLDLQGRDHWLESTLGVIERTLPEPVRRFLLGPSGWEAPLDSDPPAPLSIPGPEWIDFRKADKVAAALDFDLDLDLEERDEPPTSAIGSNNWAVSGKLTADGRALVANDMHLGLNVPNIWHRARFIHPVRTADGAQDIELNGVTLPGAPVMIIGSNGHVAWGFTNAYGDWSDLIDLELDPKNSNRYRTPDGWRGFGLETEVVQVKGAEPKTLTIRTTIWGPVIREGHPRSAPRALRWAVYDRDAVNMEIRHLAEVRTAEQALDVANRSGIPHVNFVVGDDQGNIGWTIMGRVPNRIGFDGRTPTSWADGSRRWDGYLDPSDVPRIVNPPGGRIWTANNRVVSGEALGKIGWGNYDLGARARQIRDGLQAKETFNEADMLAIQLDDRAIFLQRWRDLLLSALNTDPNPAPKRQELKAALEHWGGRAVPESVGFRFVHEYRRRIQRQLTAALVAPCLRSSNPGASDFHLEMLHEWEAPIWSLAHRQPPHLLPRSPQWSSWSEYLLKQADLILEAWSKDGEPFREHTWGDRNRVQVRHHFSPVLPGFVQSWFNMPEQELAGAWGDMPRVQTPNAGASQRMAVAPGQEDRGVFHMPCGQSGHPLSPHYRDGHKDWADGAASPFLPGPPDAVLLVRPASSS